eukprot:m.61081 g.61081  ORF g.61081 m.61081 type:complete len:693 (-) comp7060_c0_seq1:698-2776(-)
MAEYIAIYDFAGSGPGQLTVRAGDRLTRVYEYTPDWWQAECLRTHESGLVPATYVRTSLANGLTAKHGFHADVSQSEAERLLSAAGISHGTYLVRQDSSTPSLAIISIRAKGGKVQHVRVHQSDVGAVLDGDNVVRGTLPELLKYYEAFELKSGWGKLKTPLETITPPAPAPAQVPAPAPALAPAPAPPAPAAGPAAGEVHDGPLTQAEEIAQIEGRMEAIYNAASDGNYSTAQRKELQELSRRRQALLSGKAAPAPESKSEALQPQRKAPPPPSAAAASTAAASTSAASTAASVPAAATANSSAANVHVAHVEAVQLQAPTEQPAPTSQQGTSQSSETASKSAVTSVPSGLPVPPAASLPSSARSASPLVPSSPHPQSATFAASALSETVSLSASIAGTVGSMSNHPGSLADLPSSRASSAFSLPAGPRMSAELRSLAAPRGLVQLVRDRNRMPFAACRTAVQTVLDFITKRSDATTCAGILAALEAAGDVEGSDRPRLEAIMQELTDMKNDAQQRSWSIYDDSDVIGEYLGELKQLVGEADPQVVVSVLRGWNSPGQQGAYEFAETLVVYYQMESRVNLRELVLELFFEFGALDPELNLTLQVRVLSGHICRLCTRPTGRASLSHSFLCGGQGKIILMTEHCAACRAGKRPAVRAGRGGNDAQDALLAAPAGGAAVVHDAAPHRSSGFNE